MLHEMKSLIFFASLLALLSLGACSTAGQGVDGVGQTFEDGIQGRGKIVPNNPTSDSFGSDYQ